MNMNINRHDEPVRTSVWRTELPIPNAIMREQKLKTNAAEVGWNLSDSTEPSRWQNTAMVAEGSRTVSPAKECDQSECYIKENVTGRKFARKNDQNSGLGPDRVRPVVTEDAPADRTEVVVIHGNYLEISGPRIPGVFLKLAEEARNIVIVDGRSVNMKTAQLQRTGRTDPVFVAEIVNSCPMLRDDALVATGTSTKVIPYTDLREQSEPVNRSNPVGQIVSPDGRGVMVDRSNFVSQYNSPNQSAFPGLDVGRTENVPFIRGQPGPMMSQIQPVADGPAGPDRTRRPVGTDEIQVLHDVDRPMAGGPVGPVLPSDPLGPSWMSSLDDLHQPLTVDPLDTDGIYAVDASDWLTAGGPVDRSLGLDPIGPSGMSSLVMYNQPRAVGPVGKPSRPGPTAHPHTVDAPDWQTAGGPMDRLLNLDPMGPSGMISLDGYNQPPAVGPVGKPSRPGPGDHPGSKAAYGQTIQLKSESEGANDVPDPVIQTGSDVWTDRMNIGTVHGQTGSCDTRPSSDSGVHSLEEQWENMSTESLDTTSEQTEGGPVQLDSETIGSLKTKCGQYMSVNVIQFVPMIGIRTLLTWQIFLMTTARRPWNSDRGHRQGVIGTVRLRTHQNFVINRPTILIT